MAFIPEIFDRYWKGPNGGKLKIVVLDRAYDTIQSTRTQQLLASIFAMKIAGYRKHYPYGVLPADTYDLVATHMLLCEEFSEDLDKNGNSKLIPLMGMKFTTLDRCKTHHLDFPLYHIVDPKYSEHYKSVKETMRSIEMTYQSCAYSSSWTMSDSVRADKNFSKFCKSLNIALFYYYKEAFAIDQIVDGATTRFKIHEWKSFMGYEPFDLFGKVLTEVPCDPFFGEPILLMKLKQVTSAGLDFVKQFDYLWQDRLEISDSNQELEYTQKVGLEVG